MTGEPDNYGPIWSAAKLDMPKRRRELTAYIDTYLPELRTMEPGLVIDVGCGPGDFLAMCREMGHGVLGIDAPNGKGGMGDAYVDLCKEYHRLFGITVVSDGLSSVLERWVAYYFGSTDPVCCINMRGSIEQCLSEVIIGEPHDQHHDCRKLDWYVDVAGRWLSAMMDEFSRILRPGGILLIYANGTKSTDEWYDGAIREAACHAGLRIVHRESPLVHKWRKP